MSERCAVAAATIHIAGLKTFDQSIFVLAPLLLVIALVLLGHLIGLFIG